MIITYGPIECITDSLQSWTIRHRVTGFIAVGTSGDFLEALSARSVV
jgi:hypothetical protein